MTEHPDDAAFLSGSMFTSTLLPHRWHRCKQEALARVGPGPPPVTSSQGDPWDP